MAMSGVWPPKSTNSGRGTPTCVATAVTGLAEDELAGTEVLVRPELADTELLVRPGKKRKTDESGPASKNEPLPQRPNHLKSCLKETSCLKNASSVRNSSDTTMRTKRMVTFVQNPVKSLLTNGIPLTLNKDGLYYFLKSQGIDGSFLKIGDKLYKTIGHLEDKNDKGEEFNIQLEKVDDNGNELEDATKSDIKLLFKKGDPHIKIDGLKECRFVDSVTVFHEPGVKPSSRAFFLLNESSHEIDVSTSNFLNLNNYFRLNCDLKLFFI